MKRGRVKLGKCYGKSKGRTGQFTVPAAIMQHLEPGSLFDVELTEEGILYRPVEGEVQVQRSDLPEWLQG